MRTAGRPKVPAALLSSLAVAGVAAVGTVAAIDALQGPSRSPADIGATRQSVQEVAGRAVPPAQELAGTLFFARLGGCRVQSMKLATSSFGKPGPTALCRLWASPAGSVAAVPVRRGFREGAVTYDVMLVRLGDPSVVERRLATVRGDVAWSPDGERLAWCTPHGTTVVLNVASWRRRRVPGCRPKIAPQGFVLTRPDRPLAATLLREGRPFLNARDLMKGFSALPGSLVDLLGYDVREDGLLALAVALFEPGRTPQVAVQLWRRTKLEAVIPLPALGSPAGRGRFGERVEFSPDGSELAVAFPAPGFRIVLIGVEERRIVLPPTSQHGFDWSPDSRWFALSTGEEILVYGSPRAEPRYVIPIGASAIAWR